MRTMQLNLMALVAGLLFGLGLGISQMVDRERVLNFLDVTGIWDPTLLFVLGGAVAITVISFRLVLRRPHPLLADKFYLPTNKDIDIPLIAGSVIFGIGWGIAGYCPGPGITALVLGSWNPVFFIVALIAGSLLYRWYSSHFQLRPSPKPTPEPPISPQPPQAPNHRV
jgi:uncharacterized protein